MMINDMILERDKKIVEWLMTKWQPISEKILRDEVEGRRQCSEGIFLDDEMSLLVPSKLMIYLL